MNAEERERIHSIVTIGNILSVVDDEGVIQTMTNKAQSVICAIEAVEECVVRVYDSLGGKLGELFYVDGELNDYSDNEMISALVKMTR